MFEDPYAVKGMWFFAVFIPINILLAIWGTKKKMSWDDTVPYGVAISAIFWFIFPIWILGLEWWWAGLILMFLTTNGVMIVLGGGFRHYRRFWNFLRKNLKGDNS